MSEPLAGWEIQEADPTEVALKVAIIVREHAVWVGIYRSDIPSRPGGVHMWSRTLKRPAGKTPSACVAAGMLVALQAQEAGQVLA